MSKIKVQAIETPPDNEEAEENTKSSSSEREEEAAKPVKQKASQKMLSCPNCNKSMLQKTYRYYHSLKCKPNESAVQETQPQERHEQKPEKIEVRFDNYTTRRAVHNDKIKRLASRAF